MSDYICENTVIRILKYLPVKSLLQFRCVCKWWKELIDSQEFMEEHLAVQKPRFLVSCDTVSYFAVVELRTQPLVHPLPTPYARCALSIFGTLHGVVCLYNWSGGKILLWNPSIRKFSSIPDPLDFTSGYMKCFGFWIEPSTSEYKVMILMFGFAILYSSIKREWSGIPLTESENDWFPYEDKDPPHMIIGGVAYWRGPRKYTDIETVLILSFDFKQERFEIIKMPNMKHCTLIKLIKWQGKLSVVCWDQDFPNSCEIYTRREGSWINMFSFNLPSPATDFFRVRTLGEINGRFWVLFTTKPGYLFRRIGGTDLYNLGLYDSRVGCTPLIEAVRYENVLFDFVESLLFPVE